MRVHLLRHAKTNQVSPTGQDFDRQLLPRGYEQLAELKTFFRTYPLSPIQILCSSAMRTKQTLHEIIDLWPNANVQYIDELYLASKHDILNAICTLNSPHEILVVGHNEGLSELAIYLTNQALWLKTCGFVSLDLPFETSAFISADTGNIRAVFRVV